MSPTRHPARSWTEISRGARAHGSDDPRPHNHSPPTNRDPRLTGGPCTDKRQSWARGILLGMSEDSTTPDLVELTRQSFETAKRRDLDAALTLHAPDAVLESVAMGMSFEGTAIRGFYEDWIGAYDEFSAQQEEVVDLGDGVVSVVSSQRGRLVGSSGEVQSRSANVMEWEDGKLKRRTIYHDIDVGRATAERLAQERGQEG